MSKNKILITTILIFSLIQSAPAFAEEPRGLLKDLQSNFEKIQKQENKASIAARKQELKAKKEQTNLSSAKKKADQAINKRVEKLNELLQKIQNDQELSSDEKSNLSSDIQSAINGLTTLKAKIDSDTDAATLKSDVKQIATNFKVYEVITPKTRLLITIGNLQSVSTKISNFVPKIEDLINTLKSEGKDVSKLQGLLEGVSNRLTTINTQLTSDKTLILSVSASTTDPKSTFTQVRKDLASVRQNFAQIRHDFAQMRETFHLIITGGDSGRESASPTPATSPTQSPTPTPSASATPTPTPAI